MLLISIHALREEGDRRRPAACCPSHHFYPRPPRGGRPVNPSALVELVLISIHALREEGDVKLKRRMTIKEIFLSTPSARRATHKLYCHYFAPLFLSTPSARRATGVYTMARVYNPISIHALREEGDA